MAYRFASVRRSGLFAGYKLRALTDSTSSPTDVISKCGGSGSDDVAPSLEGREPSTTDDVQPVAPSSHGKDDDDERTAASSAAAALSSSPCLSVGGRRPRSIITMLGPLDKRRGSFQNLRTAFAPLPGSAWRSTVRSAARWSQPETPGVSNAPPSFEDHVANPMRGGYERPGIEGSRGRLESSCNPSPPV